MYHLALQDRVRNNPFAVLGSHARQPNHLLIFLPINKDIGRELMPANVRNEQDACASGPRVISIADKPQRSKVSLQFPLNQRRCDSASRVSSLVRAEKNHVVELTRPRGHAGFLADLARVVLCVGCAVDELMDQVGDVCLRDRVHKGECGQDEDGCWLIRLDFFAVVVWRLEIGRGYHVSLSTSVSHLNEEYPSAGKRTYS